MSQIVCYFLFLLLKPNLFIDLVLVLFKFWSVGRPFSKIIFTKRKLFSIFFVSLFLCLLKLTFLFGSSLFFSAFFIRILFWIQISKIILIFCSYFLSLLSGFLIHFKMHVLLRKFSLKISRLLLKSWKSWCSFCMRIKLWEWKAIF